MALYARKKIVFRISEVIYFKRKNTTVIQKVRTELMNFTKVSPPMLPTRLSRHC